MIVAVSPAVAELVVRYMTVGSRRTQIEFAIPEVIADVVDLDVALGQLVAQARASGLQLTGEGGLLRQLTKMVVESALDGEITDHLGYGHSDAAGRGTGNSRNGTRSKTVVTDVGPVEIDVPRDRGGSFEPQIVRKRQRRLNGVENMVLTLSARPPDEPDLIVSRSSG